MEAPHPSSSSSAHYSAAHGRQQKLKNAPLSSIASLLNRGVVVDTQPLPSTYTSMSTIRYEYDEGSAASSSALPIAGSPSSIFIAQHGQALPPGAMQEADDPERFAHNEKDESFDLARYVLNADGENDEEENDWVNDENLLDPRSIEPTLMGDEKFASIINDVACLPTSQLAPIPVHPRPFVELDGNCPGRPRVLTSAACAFPYSTSNIHCHHQQSSIQHRRLSLPKHEPAEEGDEENTSPNIHHLYSDALNCSCGSNSRELCTFHHSMAADHTQQYHVIVSGEGFESSNVDDEEEASTFFYGIHRPDEVYDEEDSQLSGRAIKSSRGKKRRSDEASSPNSERGGSGSSRRQSKAAGIELPQMAGGYIKPSYSYSCLIGLALKNSTNGELTVSEIYAFLWCFMKIEIEMPGSQGRKSCLWRINPAKETKMESELKKWRERYEPSILRSMCSPGDLDAIQNGTKGMPPTMRRRIFLPTTEETYVTTKSVKPSIIRKTVPLVGGSAAAASSTSRQKSNAKQAESSSSPNAGTSGQLSGGSSASRHEDAARKLEMLLQQTKTGQLDPTSPPAAARKRSSTGSRHSSSSTSSAHHIKSSPPDYMMSPPRAQSSSQQHRRARGSSSSAKKAGEERGERYATCGQQASQHGIYPVESPSHLALLEHEGDGSRGENFSRTPEPSNLHSPASYVHRSQSGHVLVIRTIGESPSASRLEGASYYRLQTGSEDDVICQSPSSGATPLPPRLKQHCDNGAAAISPKCYVSSSCYDIATNAINNNSLLADGGGGQPGSSVRLSETTEPDIQAGQSSPRSSRTMPLARRNS